MCNLGLGHIAPYFINLIVTDNTLLVETLTCSSTMYVVVPSRHVFVVDHDCTLSLSSVSKWKKYHALPWFSICFMVSQAILSHGTFTPEYVKSLV